MYLENAKKRKVCVKMSIKIHDLIAWIFHENNPLMIFLYFSSLFFFLLSSTLQLSWAAETMFFCSSCCRGEILIFFFGSIAPWKIIFRILMKHFKCIFWILWKLANSGKLFSTIHEDFASAHDSTLLVPTSTRSILFYSVL